MKIRGLESALFESCRQFILEWFSRAMASLNIEVYQVSFSAGNKVRLTFSYPGEDSSAKLRYERLERKRRTLLRQNKQKFDSVVKMVKTKINSRKELVLSEVEQAVQLRLNGEDSPPFRLKDVTWDAPSKSLLFSVELL